MPGVSIEEFNWEALDYLKRLPREWRLLYLEAEVGRSILVHNSWPSLFETVGPTAAAAAAIARVAIKDRGDTKRARIQDETKRLEIEAETARASEHERAETQRERIRAKASLAANAQRASPSEDGGIAR